MENITGPSVVGANYLRTRLYLVKELKDLIRKTSVLIEAPRKYGKTSIIKELMLMEDKKSDDLREFNILFFELEGEESINDFCYTFFKQLLTLYKVRNKWHIIKTFTGDLWNTIASRFHKLSIPEFEIELREQTRDFDFSKWRKEIEPLVLGLNKFEKITIIAFDELPDMLMNLKTKNKEAIDFKEACDSLMAWLRSLRQISKKGAKYQFIFCGSINLRKTLEGIGISKRISDLEALRVPPMKKEEALLLINELRRHYKINIDKNGIEFITDKITDGPPYYGQIVFKALRTSMETEFILSNVQSIYDAMLHSGDHDLNHFHSRLEDHLTQLEKNCSNIILKNLCCEAMSKQQIYDTYLHDKCDNETFA